MKLGDYQGKKVREPDFSKKILDLKIPKRLQISPKSGTLIFFLKNGSNDLFGFRLEVSTKYDLQFE